jgi:uncharacterized protein (DUF1330 family)
MAAYVVVTREKTRNPDLFAQYKAKVRPTLSPHGAILLANQGRHDVLEGAPTEGVVLLKFPTYDDALAWYHSEAYQSVSVPRLQGSDHRYVIFEGVDEP